MVYLRDDGATYRHGIVLLGFCSKVGQVVRRIVDATNQPQRPIDHHDLAVHAPQHVDAFAQNAFARVKHPEVHTRLHQAAYKVVGQVG